MISPADEERAISQLVERLTAQFPGVPENSIDAIVHASHERFNGNPIRDFVPVLVERAARAKLLIGRTSS